MMKIKYYMNNPCEVIRTVGNDFSEVVIKPHFNDDVDGECFCSQCQVGDNGTPTPHVCEEYDDVIRALEDVDNRIICLVENRLLADEPIEFKPYTLLVKKIEVTHKQILEKEERLSIVNNQILEKEEMLSIVNNQIEKSQVDLANLERKTSILTPKQQETIKSTEVPQDNLREYIRQLEKRDFILSKLEEGGVDNWEWYSESYPSAYELSFYD